MGSCASSGNVASETGSDTPARPTQRKGRWTDGSPLHGADLDPVEIQREILLHAARYGSEEGNVDLLTYDNDPMMQPAGYHHRTNSSTCVSFNEENAEEFPINGHNHTHCARAAQSPTSILLKSSSLTGNNHNNGCAYPAEVNGPDGPEEWRQRRLARANGEDLASSHCSSRGGSARGSSTGSRSTPTPRFLNVEDKFSETQREEQEFARVQGIVSRMRGSSTKGTASGNFSANQCPSYNYSAIRSGDPNA